MLTWSDEGSMRRGRRLAARAELDALESAEFTKPPALFPLSGHPMQPISPRTRSDDAQAPRIRHDAAALVLLATTLLAKSGVRDDIAGTVAELLVDADLMGHTTHGLALLAPYLDEIAKGGIRGSGEPTLLEARTATQFWDGNRLPGPWLTRRAFDAASVLAREHGTGTVVIRRSHHIACLAVYLAPITARGQMGIVHCSDANGESVAPFGGLTAVFTPNPFAAGIPTSGDPILLDISASYTTNGLTQRLFQQGARLPHPWVQDAHGNATDDPAVLFNEPKGTLLPLGGHEAGHKGFALALFVEALTAGLAGLGRADPKEGWGATVFVQVIDPSAFGGVDAMRRQMDHIVAACHDSAPRDPANPVRMPGERAQHLAREQRAHGVALEASILPLIAPWAQKLGVAMPSPMR
jgi:LDH2 family malate/lactate/ureidoglycolate dehydrogenase